MSTMQKMGPSAGQQSEPEDVSLKGAVAQKWLDPHLIIGFDHAMVLNRGDMSFFSSFFFSFFFILRSVSQ